MVSVLPRTRAEMERGIAQNLHPGAQVWLWCRNQGELELAVGDARPDVAMRTDHLLPWMSMTKPLVAAAVMQCVERQQLQLDTPVGSYLPDFAQQGKQAITPRHLLTHTAGLRTAASNNDPRPWPQIIAAICAAAPEKEWTPGQKAGYHIASSWYILGELVRIVDGRMIDQYVRQEIFVPLQMRDSWLALDEPAALAYGQRLAMSYRTDGQTMRANPASVDRAELVHVRPGASGRGPAHDLGRFYRMLLNHGELDGQRLLSSQSVALMTSRQRSGMMDQTFRQVMDWGLGLMINSAHLTPLDLLPYNFGPGAHRDTFGHGGAQSSISFADSQRQVAAVIIFNGMPGEPRHHARMRPLLAALWEDIDAICPMASS